MSRGKGLTFLAIGILIIIGGIAYINSSKEISSPLPKNEETVETRSIEPNTETIIEQRARTDRYNAEVSKRLRFNQAEAKLVNDPTDRTTLSDEALLLYDENVSEADAQVALHKLLTRIRFLGKEKSYPSGLNVEVTNALLGVNSRKVAYLPMDSPRINKNGELIDEYGTPYLFHTNTGKDLTIISAGPDKLLQTPDDFEYSK